MRLLPAGRIDRIITSGKTDMAKIPAWWPLLSLPISPTFPFLVGALREKGFLPDSGDDYADGLLLLRDMEQATELDEEQEAVSIEYCGTLKVPVFRLRDRSGAVYCKSLFPAEGKERGRLRFSKQVEPEAIADLEACFDRFYTNSKYQHDEAFEQNCLSRDRETKKWIPLVDDSDFQEALEALEEIESLRSIIEVEE